MSARKDHTRSYYQPYHPCPWQAIKWRIVKEAVVNRGWVKDIRGALTLKATMEYLQLCDLLQNVTLQDGFQCQYP